MNYALELRRVLLTLDKVEVKGRANMDMLLGCMMKLDHMASDMEKQQAAAAQPVAMEAAPANP